MCDSCDVDDDETPGFNDGERLLLVDVALIGVRCLGNIIGTTGMAVHGLANLLGNHSTYVRNREAFAIQAGREIDRLTGGDS